MNIESLRKKYMKFDYDLGLYDLTRPTLNYIGFVNFDSFLVRREHEMRIDLIFQEMYGFEPNQANFLNNIDIILFLNNIDNPINIKENMLLYYPRSIEDFYKFRVQQTTIEEDKLSIKERLVVPNKSTRKDKSRENFKNNNYSLPPVVLDTPRNPVRLKDGKFSIGGL